MSEESAENVQMFCEKCAPKTKIDIKHVKIGDFVKYAFPLPEADRNFWLNTHKMDITAERMWVIVQRIGRKFIYGELNNEPAFTCRLKVKQAVKVPIAEIVDHWEANRDAPVSCDSDQKH